MRDWILSHEAQLRLGIFAGLFVLFSLWEAWHPFRKRIDSRVARWPINWGLMLVSTLLVRVAIPIGAVAVAVDMQEASFGLLNQFALPNALAILVAIIALDLVIYVQHVVFHHVPILWKMHRVHHCDRDFDATTALRFHPLEILISLGIKFGAVALLGVPPLAVILFEILLNGCAMFNHSNAGLPLGLDKWLRWILVTPDMHRIHHSTVVEETNSNYGFNLPWWDRIFRSYRANPAAGRQDLVIGLAEFQAKSVSVAALLLLPVSGNSASDSDA